MENFPTPLLFQKDPKDEIKTETPDEIEDIVEKILLLNKQNKEGQGLKILIPEQMLSKLPIIFAQSKAGNNSEKPKN